MKKILTVLALFIGAVAFSALGQSSAVNVEELMRAFVRADAVRFQGGFNYTLVSNGVSRFYPNEYVMTRTNNNRFYRITKLSVGGINIPLAIPLVGIPNNTNGIMTSFNFWVNGINAAGQSVIYGAFNTNLLLRGTPINVVLHPEYVQMEFDEALPRGMDPANARIRVTTSTGITEGYYNESLRRFVAFVDPVATPISYEIYDASNTQIAIVKPVPAPASGGSSQAIESALNFTLEGGGLIIPFVEDGDDSYSLIGQKFGTNTVVRNNTLVPGRVYGADLGGASLEVMAYGLASGSKIEVREVTAYGTMPLRGSLNANGSGNDSLIIQPGYQAVVITITGSPINNSGYNIYFGRYYGAFQ